MKRSGTSGLMVLITAATPVAAAAPQVGEKAPAIKIAKWVTDPPPALPGEANAEQHVYLIEFWATWLPKCMKSIPHLAELYEKHREDGLVVIGISNEEPETILEFIKKKQKMSYHVGYDDDMATSAAWTGDGEEDGEEIPYAFLIDRSGIVVWRGDSVAGAEAMDKVIEEVLAGTYDLEAAKLAASTARKFARLMSELQTAYAAGDQAKAFELLEQMIKLRPDEAQPYFIRRHCLRRFDMADKIPAWDAKILETFKASAGTMRQLAERGLEGDYAERDPAMLLRSAARANALTKGQDAETLAVLARVQWELSMPDAAIASQTQAMSRAPDDRKDRYRKVLAYYQTARRLARQQGPGPPAGNDRRPTSSPAPASRPATQPASRG